MDILKNLHIAASIAAGLLMSGCFTDFDPEIDSTPVVCMNSNLVSGERVEVELTRTWAWDEGEPDNLGIILRDAAVMLIVNDGEVVETLRFEQIDDGLPDWYPHHNVREVYVSTYVPRPGDKIRLEAHSDQYGDATAETEMPQEVSISAIDWERRDFYESDWCGEPEYRMDLNMRVEFTDPARAVNYYQLECSVSNNIQGFLTGGEEDADRYPYGMVYSGIIDFEREPLFTEHVSALESIISDTWGYSFFSDRQIAGQTYRLRLGIKQLRYQLENTDIAPDIRDSEIVVTLRSLSPSYYMHVLSIWQANDGIAGALGSVGLGEMVYTHSNVSTGAGIVAASTASTLRLPVHKLISSESGTLR